MFVTTIRFYCVLQCFTFLELVQQESTTLRGLHAQTAVENILVSLGAAEGNRLAKYYALSVHK